MKISTFLLASFFIIFGIKVAQASSQAEKQVEEFVSSCFKAVGAKRWQNHAECYEKAGLTEYQNLYLELMSRDQELVPPEFSEYYKQEMTIEKLRALKPTEFFAAFLGGTIARLEARGGFKQGPLLFEIASITKNTEGKYHVVFHSTARLIQGNKTHESRKTEVTTVLFQDGKPYIELPKQMIDLLKIRK